MRSRIIIAVILLFGAPGTPDEPRRREVGLQTEGPLDGKSLADFNGDGRVDILLVSRRQYMLFLQGPGGFPPRPHQVGPFPPDAVLYDTGDVTGDGAAEIVILGRDGFSTLSLEQGRFPPRPRPLLKEASVFLGRSPSVVHEKDILRDLDGDGREDLILPTSSGITLVRSRGPGKFESREKIYIPLGASVSTGRDRIGSEVVSSFWLSRIHPGDYTGDDRTDIGVTRGDALWVFAQDEKGVISSRVSRTVPIRLPRQNGEKSQGKKEGGIFQVDYQLPLAIEDINGDRFPDFLTSHVGKGSTHIFLGSPERKELRTPSQIVKVQGFTVFNSIQDLDGDGWGDLVVASVPKIGLWGALKIFITRSITAEAHIYYNRGKSLYPMVPDYKREVDIPLIARKGERMGVGTPLIVTVTGDWDGDGLNDLVLRTGEDRIGIFPGSRRAGFATRPSEEIEIFPLAGSGHQIILPTTQDLDGDGRDDLILYYRSWDRERDRLSVILTGAAKR